MYSRWSPLNVSPKSVLEYIWECAVSWNLMSHMFFCIVHSCCFDVGTKFSTSRVAFSSRNSFKTGTSVLKAWRKRKKIFPSCFHHPKCIFYLPALLVLRNLCWVLAAAHNSSSFQHRISFESLCHKVLGYSSILGGNKHCIDIIMVGLKKKTNAGVDDQIRGFK